MKKLLLVAALFALVLPAKAMDSTILKLSVWNQIAVPNIQSVKGLDLALGQNNTADVIGVQLALLWTRSSASLTGIQLTYGFAEAAEVTGVQAGTVNMVNDMKGLQLGAVNFSKNEFTGAQIAFFNSAQTLHGLQLGFVNYAKNLDSGLQIGLVNLAENGWFPVMVFVNGRF